MLLAHYDKVQTLLSLTEKHSIVDVKLMADHELSSVLVHILFFNPKATADIYRNFDIAVFLEAYLEANNFTNKRVDHSPFKIQRTKLTGQPLSEEEIEFDSDYDNQSTFKLMAYKIEFW